MCSISREARELRSGNSVSSFAPIYNHLRFDKLTVAMVCYHTILVIKFRLISSSSYSFSYDSIEAEISSDLCNEECFRFSIFILY